MLEFKNRRRDVWGWGYTELFFLDEVTALAAGHRPCFECRRADANSFAEKWAQTKGSDFPYVDEKDRVLQAERLDGRAKRTHVMKFGNLLDGAFVTLNNEAYAVRGSHLLRCSESGYVEKIARPHGNANVLTPPSIFAVLAAGYEPQWHPSAL